MTPIGARESTSGGKGQRPLISHRRQQPFLPPLRTKCLSAHLTGHLTSAAAAAHCTGAPRRARASSRQ